MDIALKRAAGQLNMAYAALEKGFPHAQARRDAAFHANRAYEHVASVARIDLCEEIAEKYPDFDKYVRKLNTIGDLPLALYGFKVEKHLHLCGGHGDTLIAIREVYDKIKAAPLTKAKR